MRALITGHKGFIGYNLKNTLDAKMSRYIYGLDEELFDSPNWKEDLESYIYKQQPDIISHVGACADTMNQDVEYMMTRNYESTVIMSNLAKRYNISFIYSSSAANYGDVNGNRNLYAWSKYAAEKHVLANCQVALRYFNVYGPGENHKGRMASVAHQMFNRHKSNQPVQLFPGRPQRDFIYVDDVVSANVHAMVGYDDLCGKYYDVGSGEANSFETVLEHLNIPYTYKDKSEMPDNYQMYTKADQSKMMPEWEPKFTLEQGLKKYKEYLCKTI